MSHDDHGGGHDDHPAPKTGNSWLKWALLLGCGGFAFLIILASMILGSLQPHQQGGKDPFGHGAPAAQQQQQPAQTGHAAPGSQSAQPIATMNNQFGLVNNAGGGTGTSSDQFPLGTTMNPVACADGSFPIKPGESLSVSMLKHSGIFTVPLSFQEFAPSVSSGAISICSGNDPTQCMVKGNSNFSGHMDFVIVTNLLKTPINFTCTYGDVKLS